MHVLGRQVELFFVEICTQQRNYCEHTHQYDETKCVSFRGFDAQCRSARQEKISVRAHVVFMDEGHYNKVEKLTCRSLLH